MTAAFAQRYSQLTGRQGISDRVSPDLLRILERLGRLGNVVELGCGDGSSLGLLRRLGFDCIGVEVDAEAAERARMGSGCEVLLGDAVDALASLPSDSADYILAMNVLEHVEPAVSGTLIGHIARVLRTDGAFLGITPNALSPYGARTRYWDLTHRTAFTPTSLQQLATFGGLVLTSTWERGPIVHDVRSSLRQTAWRAVRALIQGRLAVETGVWDHGPLTMDLCFEMKPFNPRLP